MGEAGESKLRHARLAAGMSQGEVRRLLVESRRRRQKKPPKEASLKRQYTSWEHWPFEGGVYPAGWVEELCEVFKLPAAALGFPSDQSSALALPLPTEAPSAVLTPEVMEHFAGNFAHYTRTDRKLGPHLMLASVQADCEAIDRLIITAKGSLRDEVLRLGAQYFEFAGWLAQDAGNPDAAERLSSRGLDLAYEVGDAALVSYIFMRRSNIATESGRPVDAIGLAHSALRGEPLLGPKSLALVLRQEARSLALLGDERDAVASIERAVDLASVTDGPAEPHADYCTPSYVQMERASTLSRLGRLTEASELLETAVASWPAEEHRDKGIALGRLADIHAATGEVEAAVIRGQEAVDVIRTAPSSRALGELDRLRQRLDMWKSDRRVSALNSLITEVRN